MSGCTFHVVRAARTLAIAAVYASAFGSIAQGAVADPSELRVMSFNIRLSKAGHSEAAREAPAGAGALRRRLGGDDREGA